MAKVTVLCWQEIPSSIEVRDAKGTHKAQLSQRFMELIDMIAMRRKLDSSDDYLAQWHKQKRPDRAGEGSEIVKAVVAEIEAQYDEIHTSAIKSSQR